jgi:hypothetical protein
MLGFKVICGALLFIFKLRFSPGVGYQLATFVFITDVSKNLQNFVHVHDHFI